MSTFSLSGGIEVEKRKKRQFHFFEQISEKTVISLINKYSYEKIILSSGCIVFSFIISAGIPGIVE